MPRRINTHGGGARTNINGLHFEQNTQLNDALEDAGYIIRDNYKVYYNNQLVGYSTPKYSLYKDFLKPNGINYKDYNSKRWEPDELFINIHNKTAYVIEKKFQNSSGSVDEKLGSCEFKRHEYEKLFYPLDFNVEYIYIFNDWFKNPIYDDVLDYIESKDCFIFFNEIPLNAIGL